MKSNTRRIAKAITSVDKAQATIDEAIDQMGDAEYHGEQAVKRHLKAIQRKILKGGVERSRK
jgi:hypothetical protein